MRNEKILLSIDPGNEFSAYCLIDMNTYKLIKFGKVANQELKDYLQSSEFSDICSNNHMYFSIEMIASYGMAVGQTVFETCVWIGRFIEIMCCNHQYIYRKDVKMNLCGTMKAKDTNIRQALIDRFGEVGTKKNQGFFYGFKADIWSAYAVGVTFIDTCKH